MVKSKLKKVAKWHSPYTNKVVNDEDCVGMGSPPSCIAYQTDNPGAGRLPMVRIFVEETEESNA